jgi:hypothetical protein
MRLLPADAHSPRVLPAAWRRVEPVAQVPHALVFERKCGLRVILGVEDHGTGRWLHVSFARSYRLPGWDDLREVKDLFVGPDKLAVQVLPPADQYVNAHRFCLHLWRRLDGPTLAGAHPQEA